VRVPKGRSGPVKTETSVPAASAADFEELAVEMKCFWWSGVNRVMRIGGDGKVAFSLVSRTGLDYESTYQLSRENLATVAGLLRATDWLRKPPEKVMALDAVEFALSLKRSGETARADFLMLQTGPYQPLERFLTRLAEQEHLLYRLSGGKTGKGADAASVIASDLRGLMRRPGTAQPTEPLVLDYSRFLPIMRERLAKPDGHTAGELLAATVLAGYLRDESARKDIESLAAKGKVDAREGVPALVRIGNPASVTVLGRMARKGSGHSDAAWGLVQMGDAALPTILEIIGTPIGSDGGDPTETMIRAYIDHWKGLPAPPSVGVIKAVRAGMEARQKIAYRPSVEYHLQFLSLAGETKDQPEASPPAPAVRVTLFPSTPIRSLQEYSHSYKARFPSMRDVKKESCEFEIRSGDGRRRIARLPYASVFNARWLRESLAPDTRWRKDEARGGWDVLTVSGQRRIGPLPDGGYWAALIVDGVRCSNVATLTVDSKFDPSREPTLKLFSVPGAPGAGLPFLGLRAIGPTPQDPDLTNFAVTFPDVFADGAKRKWRAVFWNGFVGPLESGRIHTVILDIGGNLAPAIEPGKPHEIYVKVGEYQSEPITISPEDPLGKAWDDNTGSLAISPPPIALLRGKVTGLDGRPASGYEVTLFMPKSQLTELCNEDGLYEFYSIPPGKYGLTCRPNPQAQSQLHVLELQIEKDTTRTLDLDVESRYSISGRVKTSDGKPAAGKGVWVKWKSPEGNRELNNTAIADSEGRYSSDSPFPVAATVEVLGGGRETRTYQNVQAGRKDVDFVLQITEESKADGQDALGLRLRVSTPRLDGYPADAHVWRGIELPLLLELKNISDQPFDVTRLPLYADPEVEDMTGKRFIVKRRDDVTPWEGREGIIPPGGVARWNVWFDRLRFTEPLTVGSTVRIRFKLPLRDEANRKPGATTAPLLCAVSNTLEFPIQTPHPNPRPPLVQEKWGFRNELVWREGGGLMGYYTVRLYDFGRVDGFGFVEVVARLGSKQDKLLPMARTAIDALLPAERFHRVAGLLAAQKIGELAKVPQEEAYPDEPEILLSFSDGGPSFVGEFPMRVAEKQPALVALKQEMRGIIAEAAEAAKKDDTGWGEAVCGEQVRLRVEKTEWTEGETPEFWADSRNLGPLDLFLGSSHYDSAIEWDGEWYEYTGPVSRRVPYPPYRRYSRNIQIPLSPGGWTKKGKTPQQRIILSPGAHTIRIAFPGLIGTRDYRTVYAVSNPVEIEIGAPAAAAGDFYSNLT